MRVKKLTIIVPVYNEIITVEKVIKRLGKLNLGKTKKEIIVVDDGSTDGTAQSLRKLSKTGFRNFKYIFHTKNQGKGRAIQTGLIRATGDYVIIQDADLEYEPAEIRKLLIKAEKDNLPAVFGSRDSGDKRQYIYPHYYWGSRALCRIINTAFGVKFTDPETCYKLIKTDLLREMNLEENGFGIEMEIVAKISVKKVPFGEVPITYKPRSFSEGKKIRAKDGLRAIFLIGKYWWYDKFS